MALLNDYWPCDRCGMRAGHINGCERLKSDSSWVDLRPKPESEGTVFCTCNSYPHKKDCGS